MNTLVIVIGIIGLAFVQIMMFKSLPAGLQRILAYVPLIGIIVNFGFSQFILHFIGLAYGIGMANMLSSVIFGFYIYYYKSKIEVKKRILGFPILQDKKLSYDDYANKAF